MKKNAIAQGSAEDRKPFVCPNKTLYGRACGSRGYAVFSYGEHWPLWVHDGAQWFENSDRYSNTTAHHRMQSHPTMYRGGTTTLADCAQMKALVRLLDADAPCADIVASAL